MTLRRTASALYSINRFYQADIVVFCEGGQPIKYRDILYAANTATTLDELYWETTISAYNTSKRYHVKSVGSKETLRKIANDVHRQNITSITICMDSDYDRLRGTNVIGPRIAWTMGYSWENDVVSQLVLERILEKIAGPGNPGTKALEDFRTRISKLGHEFQRWTEIDISLCARGKNGIFDRKKPASAIDHNNPPAAQTALLSKRLADAGYRRRPKRVVSVAEEDVPRVCFGKLIGRACYKALRAAIAHIPTVNLTYEVFMRLAIHETITAAAENKLPAFWAHIQAQRSVFT